MQRREAETNAAARSAGLCAVALGCGDIGDAQLPLPVYGAGSREVPAELELTPSRFAAVPAQAAARVRASSAAGGSCPIEFEAMLPDTSARQTFVNGAGARAIDGDGTRIVCFVLAAPDSPGAFDVSVSLRHPRLPWFRAAGRLRSLGPSVSGEFVLQLTTPDATEVTATCSVEADEVLSGAVWFHSIACQTQAIEPPAGACDVAFHAIFERCRQ
jgi:hypothetical protein